jgi:tryptophanyl-tRNA synthetase
LNVFLDPLRERRASYEARKGFVEDMLLQGTKRARAECQRTLQEAREAMGLTYFRGLGPAP